MSRRCAVTNAGPGFGNAVSHSQRRTRRRWNVNVQKRRFWLPGENRWIRLKVSARALKTIDRDGIEAVVAKMRREGGRI